MREKQRRSRLNSPIRELVLRPQVLKGSLLLELFILIMKYQIIIIYSLLISFHNTTAFMLHLTTQGIIKKLFIYFILYRFDIPVNIKTTLRDDACCRILNLFLVALDLKALIFVVYTCHFSPQGLGALVYWLFRSSKLNFNIYFYINTDFSVKWTDKLPHLLWSYFM